MTSSSEAATMIPAPELDTTTLLAILPVLDTVEALAGRDRRRSDGFGEMDFLDRAVAITDRRQEVLAELERRGLIPGPFFSVR